MLFTKGDGFECTSICLVLMKIKQQILILHIDMVLLQ